MMSTWSRSFIRSGSRSAAATRSRLPGSSSTRSAIRRTRPLGVFTNWKPVAGSAPCQSPSSSMMCSTSRILSLVLSRELTLGMWTIVFSSGSSTPQDVVGIVPRVEEIADVEPLQILIAVELLVVGVGDGLEPRLVMGHEHRRGVAPEIRSRHGHDMCVLSRAMSCPTCSPSRLSGLAETW